MKDIKTAIMATDLIVNKWHFTDYRLHIYGDMERAPAYASECQEVIASKGLRDHVVLKGLGKPDVVLQDAVSIRSMCFLLDVCMLEAKSCPCSGFS